MALLAEEIVEEWLNRQGYFTIRGIKLGVDEIDLLALRFGESNEPEYRHIEVQASMRPISYISQVPKAAQKLGRAPNSAKRSDEELVEGVKEWVERKFFKPRKRQLLQSLCPIKWSTELVLNNVKSEQEVELIACHGIKIIRFREIISELKGGDFSVRSASGADFVDLIHMGAYNAQRFE